MECPLCYGAKTVGCRLCGGVGEVTHERRAIFRFGRGIRIARLNEGLSKELAANFLGVRLLDYETVEAGIGVVSKPTEPELPNPGAGQQQGPRPTEHIVVNEPVSGDERADPPRA